MNLALTYASRTQHLRLARQISELIQQKSTSGWYSEEEDYDAIGQNEELEHNDEGDQKYAVERSEKLKQSTRVPPRVLKRAPQLNAKGLRFSKFSSSKRRKRSEDDFESENGVNETKELFTDEEQSDGEAVGEESGSDVEVGGGEGDSPTPAPTPIGLSNSEKRHNPFKVHLSL